MSNVCMTCITDAYLRQSLNMEDAPCEYCNSPGPTASVFALAQACDEVIEAHFETTHQERSVWLHGYDPVGTDLQSTLESLNFVSNDTDRDALFEALMEDLNFIWFDRDTMESKYTGTDDSAEAHFRLRSDMGSGLSEEWRRMQESLQHEARYVNPEATRVLRRVFANLHVDRGADGGMVVVDAGPSTELHRLFRARAFQAEKPLVEALSHPARFLGTPAPGIGGAGRMNSRGQPVFYGATSEVVAVAEVRPPVGAWVVTAAFEITRPLKLLDLRKLEGIKLDARNSLFEPGSILLAQRRDFLRQLVGQLTQPVMPEQQERDYLATQVVADFLATLEEGPVDGIIFPSVQTPKGQESADFNVALFPRASRVAEAEGAAIGHAGIWEYEDDGPGRYPAPSLVLKAAPALGGMDSWQPPPKAERWQAALAVDLKAINVGTVEGVQFSTYGHSLSVRQDPPSLMSWRDRDA